MTRIHTVLFALLCGLLSSSYAADSDFVVQKRQQDISHLRSSVEALLGALNNICEEKNQTELATAVTRQVNDWLEQSQTLAAAGDQLKARELLELALVRVKTLISSLRDKETLVRSLNFKDKAEEYYYELDRVETYRMLLKLLVLNRDYSADTDNKIAQLADEAIALQQQAVAQAQQQHYEQAIVLIEQVTDRLRQAIRLGGIYLPG